MRFHPTEENYEEKKISIVKLLQDDVTSFQMLPFYMVYSCMLPAASCCLGGWSIPGRQVAASTAQMPVVKVQECHVKTMPVAML